MVPTQQSLKANKTLARECYLRLVGKAELATLKGKTQVLLQAHTSPTSGAVFGRIEGNGSTRCCRWLRSFGAVEQRFRVLAITRVHRYANRCIQEQSTIVDDDGLGQRREQVPHQGLDACLVALARYRKGETILAGTRQHRIIAKARARSLQQAIGSLAHDFIGGRLAERLPQHR